MSELCRGRISAICFVICAAVLATQNAVAEPSPEAIASTVSTSLPDLSGDDLLSRPNPSPTVDVDWMIRDSRVIMPQGPSLIENTQLPTAGLQGETLGVSRSSGLPRVGAPVATEKTPDGNDTLALPAPVVSVGSAILMSAILFYVGARILRMQRRAAS